MRLTQRGGLLALSLLCFALVGAALVSQHVFDMQPCPWCILQRIIFLVIALLLLAGAFLPGRAVFIVGSVAFALAGITTALYQHFVAAKSSSCNLTLADKIISGLGLDKAVPAMFEVKASCADAAVDMLHVPYEFWSLGFFVVVAVAATYTLSRH
ncbi:MAG TPA: disulfide bond formation protein B [Piscinibacter sp.]|jgi:disulfide bond formation protein DsbB|uniref:disulfide bond formation protein B n=1 Tax=Piscinibacter sp. TaxID=1903157 RepID=UPI001B53C7A4|nr:disulfide bond formation protein B [Piscinibacter sp.]MBK7530307.1 disulfide bond formation protein B [Piscinibacter sp.]MBL0091181.1 disulfide bond formation protein B [Piscinibacter sp.]MBP6543952.1 disulfide bond formation protein B [Piscinibacter sp.]HNW64672.1 disulfide bond formation protein B [Piscinibacter sp.]HOY34200.1 disulfide bond formation protein B [Piscinibacter sp.]